MAEYGVALFLVLALLAGVLACTASFTERLLWGSAVCSCALSLAVQFSYGGYYGVVMLGSFLVADLVIYLYFRTQNLLPARPTRNVRTDRLYRVFFLWLALCGVVGGGTALFTAEPGLPLRAEGTGMTLLHERVWGPDWILVAIPIFSLLVLVMGGFFLVRKER
jgi:sterol desaturase/sphingolipid hydroxylase (fatty acid hydroxylase superfamily)